MEKELRKRMIRENLIELLKTSSFKDISVVRFAKFCGFSKNTFYNTYTNLFNVIKDILDNEVKIIEEKYNSTKSWEISLLEAANYVLKNKVIVYNVYNTSYKENVKNYLSNIFDVIMNRFIASKNTEIGASKHACDLVADFYKSALMQQVLNWLDNGMEEKPEEIVKEISKYFEGNIELALKRSLKD